MEKTELEDLYLPYKPKRRTKASMARDKGLEPLAQFLWDQQGGAPLADFATQFVSAEKGVESVKEALEGARHIIAEWISENAEFRKAVRGMMFSEGNVVSRAIEGAPDPEGKFHMYAQYSEPAAKIPSHRMLAIRRGAKEGILTFEIELEKEKALAWLRPRVIRAPGEWTPHLEEAVEDSYERLLNPSIQTEVRLELKDRSDEEAIKVFRENLENLLLSPPAGMLTVLAIDPGIRTGCKIAVVDDTGKFLENSVIYPFEPKNDLAGSVKTLASLIARHNVRTGHRHRQRDGVARDGGAGAGLSAAGGPGQDLQRFRERIGRVGVFGERDRAAGVSGPGPHGSRGDFDRTAAAGPAFRTGEGGSEIHRGRPVPARRGPAAADAESRSYRGVLREPRGCRFEHGVMGAAAVRGRDHGADGAQNHGVPQ